MIIVDNKTGKHFAGYCSMYLKKGSNVPCKAVLCKHRADYAYNVIKDNISEHDIAILSMATLEDPDQDARVFAIGDRYSIVEPSSTILMK